MATTEENGSQLANLKLTEKASQATEPSKLWPSSEDKYDTCPSESSKSDGFRSILSTNKQGDEKSKKGRTKSVRFILPEEKYSDSKVYWRTGAIEHSHPNNNNASAVQGFIVSVPQVPSRRVMATSAFLSSLSNKKVSVATPPMAARGVIQRSTKVTGRYFAPRSESVLKYCSGTETHGSLSDLESQFSGSIQALPGLPRNVHPSDVKLIQTSVFIPSSAAPGCSGVENVEKVHRQLIQKQRPCSTRPLSSSVPRPTKLQHSDSLLGSIHSLPIGSKIQAWAGNPNHVSMQSVPKPHHQNAPSVSLRTITIVPKQMSLRTCSRTFQFQGGLEGNPKHLHSRPPSSSSLHHPLSGTHFHHDSGASDYKRHWGSQFPVSLETMK